MIDNLLHLLGAFALALPMAIERERRGASAGLRTFPLVAMASCAFILVGRTEFDGDPQAMSRVLYGLMTGIGFIGGGAILKQQDGVHGTATAASIWGTGGIGAAVGFHRYEIAIALSIAVAVTLYFSPRAKEHIERETGESSSED